MPHAQIAGVTISALLLRLHRETLIMITTFIVHFCPSAIDVISEVFEISFRALINNNILTSLLCLGTTAHLVSPRLEGPDVSISLVFPLPDNTSWAVRRLDSPKSRRQPRKHAGGLREMR